jgi:leader peptidase (prepilin peptidase) / N-methyltransferase
VNHYLGATGWLVVGAVAAYGMRRLSVWLARLEELEPGFKPWQAWGPVILTAVLFAVFAWRFGAGVTLLVLSLWVLVLVQVIFFDLEHRLILDRIMFPAWGLAVLASIFFHHPGWLNAIATGLGAGGILLLLAVLGALVMRTEAMGMGDVKLAVFVGLIVGFPGTFNALLYGILLAGFISILLIVVRVKGLKDTIAYGPYLCAGALIQLFVQG